MVVKTAFHFFGGRVWQSNWFEKFQIGTIKRQRRRSRLLTENDSKVFVRTTQMDFSGGDVFEKFHEKLNFLISSQKKYKYLAKQFENSPDVTFGRDSFFWKTLKAFQILRRNLWTRLSAINFSSIEKHFSRKKVCCYMCSDFKRKRFRRVCQTSTLRIQNKKLEKKRVQTFS